jgi:hypothetical protein
MHTLKLHIHKLIKINILGYLFLDVFLLLFYFSKF